MTADETTKTIRHLPAPSDVQAMADEIVLALFGTDPEVLARHASRLIVDVRRRERQQRHDARRHPNPDLPYLGPQPGILHLYTTLFDGTLTPRRTGEQAGKVQKSDPPDPTGNTVAAIQDRRNHLAEVPELVETARDALNATADPFRKADPDPEPYRPAGDTSHRTGLGRLRARRSGQHPWEQP